MAPSRRNSNGRSPLVNQQRQITSFFTKSSSISPSPSPILSKPNPNPKTNGSNPGSSPSPTTPSPLQPKRVKTPLVIGSSAPSPTTPLGSSSKCGDDVVNRRVRVYWPLDKEWYEGCVKSFDRVSGKHTVQYDDGEEEVLDFGKEKVEVVKGGRKRLKRLRKLSMEEEEEEEVAAAENVVGFDGLDENVEDCDDSADEDWGKKGDKELVEDEMEDEALDLVDEDDDVRTGSAKKRKVSVGRSLGCNKKVKETVSKAVIGGKIVPPTTNNDCAYQPSVAVNPLAVDAAERFSARETEKLWFLGKGRRDEKRRPPGDVNYDPRTLYLPPDFLKSLTGGQRQWWEFKSKHMDKVLFFKMGKFYELFEMDAHVGAKELDLQYMKGDQPHCGFPEKNFTTNVEKLARKGYRVLVVEQTETPEQLELRRKEQGSKDKVVKREICAVVTKGTLTEGEISSANPEASYLMAVTECSQNSGNHPDGRIYGVCVVDVATSKIVVGQFGDDSDCSALSCLLCQVRPVEIIKPSKLLSPETERVLLRHTRHTLVNELEPVLEFWDAEKTISEIKSIRKGMKSYGDTSCLNDAMVVDDGFTVDSEEKKFLPQALSELVNMGDNGIYALSALGGTLFYLKQAFLDESLVRFAKFELLHSGFSNIISNPYMVLDAAALENLEIFENNKNGDSSGTLYGQLNHCVTAFGKRLLKAWLARPLYHARSINERQDAIAGLKGDSLPSVLEFRNKLSRMPDMERLLARIFSCSELNGRNAKKVVLYEDAAKKQLQEFIAALEGCELMANACSSLADILEHTESRLLHYLLSPGKALPSIHPVLAHFKKAFDWAEANSSGRIIPREGADEEYDAACRMVREIESNLANHLKEQRKLLKDSSINYVTIGKESYLLEVPESLCASVPPDYELRSSKKGFFRYWTPAIKGHVSDLSSAESEKESSLKSIMQRLVGRFCEHHTMWRQLVSAVAELDVLISLAITSDLYEGPTCRPVILDSAHADEVPSLVAKNLGHPVLRSDSLGKGTFVPNDVNIGGSAAASFILLTGPNMGGKSTLLRQVCLAAILAQVGADVPAESFEISPVDRIFVRMGAKDHIMAGHSTFLTEILETASMLSSATRNSVVALDELGRGTSTSDGQAIASSVLEHFVHKIQCRGLFSTHYHHLAVDYQNSPKVSLCHMACQVGKGVDGLEEVTFLYKLVLGACPKSYGVNVARLAGLPDLLLQKAASKSQEFEAMYGQQRKNVNLSQEDKMAALIQNLSKFLVESSCLVSADATSNLLHQLQAKAGLILRQN